MENFQRVKIKSENAIELGLRERVPENPEILVNVRFDFQTETWVDGETNEEIPKHLWTGHNATKNATPIYPKQPFTPLYITGRLSNIHLNNCVNVYV